ncbi:MAG: (d)CMP kinase [Proteobacteria bacterium]|nr:(d)CMP kinase [Pseudomonadota bacterium]
MAAGVTPVITIDGPSGTGKGTLARLITAWLGWHLLDSGALYRVTAHFAQGRGVALDDAEAVAALAACLPVEFVEGEGDTRVLLEGQDVTDLIRSEEAGARASQVAALGPVRAALLDRQHAFAEMPGLVADGRDMGTVVFPAADLKIYLTASVEERAKRRYKQLNEKGMGVNLPQLLGDIAERDRRDEQRSISPLKPATDAIILDTTDSDIAAVILHVKRLVREAGLASGATS